VQTFLAVAPATADNTRMGEKPAYPRYFIYGQAFTATSPYVIAINKDDTYVTDLHGESVKAIPGVEYWEKRVHEGAMREITREAIADEIERWNQSRNTPKLKLPE